MSSPKFCFNDLLDVAKYLEDQADNMNKTYLKSKRGEDKQIIRGEISAHRTIADMLRNLELEKI